MNFEKVDQHNVRVQLTENGPIEFDINIPFGIDTEFDSKEFTTHFFSKKDVKENDIYQVYEKESESRLGWLIPVTALFSEEHDFADNIHFKRYAYQAIKRCLKYLISGGLVNNGIIDIATNEISRSFHDYLCILIISGDCITDSRSFTIERFIPSLLTHGYVPLSERDPSDIRFEGLAPRGKRIYISEISAYVKDSELINRILAQSLAYENEPAFQFFYLYQIIELLIAEVTTKKRDQIIDKLSEGRENTQIVRECMSHLKDALSEEKRIGILSQEYCRLERSTHEGLKRSAHDFLRECDHDVIGPFNEYLYKIRNLVFHQYRNLPTDDYILRDVVREAVPVVVYLLGNYKPEP